MVFSEKNKRGKIQENTRPTFHDCNNIHTHYSARRFEDRRGSGSLRIPMAIVIEDFSIKLELNSDEQSIFI